MGEISPTLFFNGLLYLSIPFILGYIFRRVNISPIIGYIIAGILLGNFFADIASREIVNHFAFFGIALLLFTIGLEVNFEKILVLKKFIVTGGILQVLLTMFFLTILNVLFGFGFLQAFLISIALSASSTALVAKIIQDRGEESSFMGELAIGILMLQDLAFIPFIIIFTFIHGHNTSNIEVVKNIVFGIIKAGTILSAMYYIGRKVVPIIFDKVVKSSRELLNLFIVVFILLIGFLSAQFQLPILIGMFMAGVLVSQTVEHHHVFSQVRPFRDILAIIFFVYIGSSIPLGTVVGLLPKILVYSASLILIKAIIIIGIFLYFKFSSRLAFTLGVFLFQVSESAFILLSLAFQNGVLTNEQYILTISAVLTTLVVTPIFINNKDVIYALIRRFFRKYIPSIEAYIQHKIDFDRSPIDVLDLKNHIVICGYGRIGSHIGRALLLANIPFISVDYNFHTVNRAKKEGVSIFYGDPTDIDILDYAQLEHATALVIVIPDRFAQEAIILNAKKLNPRIFIMSRVHHEDHQQRMRDLGAQVVIQPELEASMSIIKKLFLMKKLSQEDIVKKIHHFKVEQGIS